MESRTYVDPVAVVEVFQCFGRVAQDQLPRFHGKVFMFLHEIEQSALEIFVH